MNQYKLLFIGPVASGKTEAVRTLCDGNIIETGEVPTDDVLKLKHQTTVALDYGTLAFGEDKKLHVYGAPGQERFEFMVDILLEGCLGVVILINLDVTPINQFLRTYHGYSQNMQEIPHVIGLTHADKLSAETLGEYVELIEDMGIDPDIVKVTDPRNKREVAELVELVLRKISKGE